MQGSGGFSFVPEGPPSGGRYNAIGFRVSDRYIYAMRQPGSRNLLRIGQQGQVTGLGAVANLPVDDYNQGTFGEGAFADTLFVRTSDATNNARMYLINVDTQVATLRTLSQNVPNLADIVFTQGFIWGVWGESQRIYRINPTTGAVNFWPLTSVPANQYGGQWVFGNGNIGLSNNDTGRVYQIQITNPAAATPTFGVLPSIPGPGSANNDGTADPGQVVNLSVDKSAPATFVAGGPVTYTITVTNNGPGVSSGWTLTDALPPALLTPTTTTPGCQVSAGVFACSGAGTLAAGEAVTVSFTGLTAAAQTGCITNTAIVIGNEQDPNAGDDSDSATTCVGPPVSSFSLQKTASPAVAHLGETVTYTVRVTNTGAVAYTAASPATFTDDLTGVLDDADYNGDASPPTATFVDPELSWSGAVPVGGFVDVSYTVTVGNPAGDYSMENVVTPGAGGECLVASQCESIVPIAAFHATKTASTASAEPGTSVTYTIEIENTGGYAYTVADPVSFTDDLSEVTDDGILDESSITGGASYTAPTLSWEGPLDIGATATITYDIDVNAPVSGDQTMTNTIVTSPGGNCDAGSIDPDCAVEVLVPDEPANLSVLKTAASAFEPGGPVVFTITVTNNGPGPSSGWTVTDNVPVTVFNGRTSSANCSVAGGVVTCIGGPLRAGESVTASFSGDTAADAPQCISNTVTVVGNEPDPDLADNISTAESCQGEPIPAFTVEKRSSPAVAHQGDVVTYTVRVVNSGPVPLGGATPATFTDDLSDVLDNATFISADSGAILNGTTLTWTGDVAVGTYVEVTYTVSVGPPGGDNLLANVVTPGEGGECPVASACVTETPIAAYIVEKTSSIDGATPGATVTYEITVTNTGGYAYTAADPASFSDDLSDVLDDATLDLASITGGAGYSAPVLSWSGALAVGAPVVIEYTVAVNDPASGDKMMSNVVVTPAEGGCPTVGPPPECRADVPVLTYTVQKISTLDQSDPAAIVVRYTVTVTNTGEGDYPGASFEDDLTGVLDDATYNGDGSAGTSFATPILSWSGDVAQDAVVQVTYSVTVNDPDEGDHHLINQVAPTGDGGTCVSDALCTTDTPVRAYTVVKAVSATQATTGTVLTYTITITNTGGTAYTTAIPATFTDDLTDDLLHATYNDDADQGAIYTEPVLSWAGALPYPGTVVVSYTVTVGDVAEAASMTNTVVSGPDGNCTLDDAEIVVFAMGPECTTVTQLVPPVPPDPDDPDVNDLAASGFGATGLWILAMTMIGAGVALALRQSGSRSPRRR